MTVAHAAALARPPAALCWRHGGRATHQDVAVLRISLRQAGPDHASHNGVVYQLACVGDGLELLAQRRASLDLSPDDVARGDGRDVELLGQARGKGTLAHTWGTQKDVVVLEESEASAHFCQERWAVLSSDYRPQTFRLTRTRRHRKLPVHLLATMSDAAPLPWSEADLLEFIECARYGELEDVVLHIKDGADVNFADPASGTTALHKAAANGHTEVVKALIANGATFTANKSGNTPLHWACLNGHKEAVEALVAAFDKAIDVYAKNSFGKSALSEAIAGGHEDIAKVLLSHDSADVDVQAAKTGAVVEESSDDDEVDEEDEEDEKEAAAAGGGAGEA